MKLKLLSALLLGSALTFTLAACNQDNTKATQQAEQKVYGEELNVDLCPTPEETAALVAEGIFTEENKGFCPAITYKLTGLQNDQQAEQVKNIVKAFVLNYVMNYNTNLFANVDLGDLGVDKNQDEYGYNVSLFAAVVKHLYANPAKDKEFTETNGVLQFINKLELTSTAEGTLGGNTLLKISAVESTRDGHSQDLSEYYVIDSQTGVVTNFFDYLKTMLVGGAPEALLEAIFTDPNLTEEQTSVMETHQPFSIYIKDGQITLVLINPEDGDKKELSFPVENYKASFNARGLELLGLKADAPATDSATPAEGEQAPADAEPATTEEAPATEGEAAPAEGDAEQPATEEAPATEKK